MENSFIEVQGSVLYSMTLILFSTHTHVRTHSIILIYGETVMDLAVG